MEKGREDRRKNKHWALRQGDAVSLGEKGSRHIAGGQADRGRRVGLARPQRGPEAW